MGNPLCGHPRASERSFPSAFGAAGTSPVCSPLSAAAPTGPGEIGARADFLCGPAAPRATRPPDPAGPRPARAAVARLGLSRSALPQRPLSLPALGSRPRRPAPSPAGFQLLENASPAGGVRINRVTGARRAGARTPRLARGGAWWGGSAGELFKLEPEPPPRGSGSRGAVDWLCTSSGRDPGVWRGVEPGGGGRAGSRKMCRGCPGEERRPR